MVTFIRLSERMGLLQLALHVFIFRFTIENQKAHPVIGIQILIVYPCILKSILAFCMDISIVDNPG